MKITQRVARKSLTKVDYEMDYFTVEMSSEDLPKRDGKLPELSMEQQSRVLQVTVQRETIIALVMANHMPMEAAKYYLAHLDSCLQAFSKS